MLVGFRVGAGKAPKIIAISLCLVVGFSLWGPELIQAQDLTGQTRFVTDLRGRSVAIPEKIDSLIALGAGSLRLISYLGAIDKIIAVEDSGHGREITLNEFYPLATYRLAYPALRTLPSIGSAENHEGIIFAAPDLIISSTIDVSQLDHLQAVLGIPVFAVDADVELDNKDLFYKQLRSLGELLAKDRRAEELIRGIEGFLNDLAARTARLQAPKRAYAGGMMWYGPADLLRTSGDYLPFDLTGTHNVMPSNPLKNQQPYLTSLEELILAAPDYVFIDAANLNLSQAAYLANQTVLDELVPAFSRQQLYATLVYKYYGTNWENQLINAFYVGKVLYPDLYDDIVIEKLAEDIWRLFFAVELDYKKLVELQKTGLGQLAWF